MILPYVLDEYGATVYKPLAELADLVGLGKGTAEEKAKAFIAEIRAMNARMGIPKKLSGIREEDIAHLARRAAGEANPLYPVPKIMKRDELEKLYHQIREL